MHEAAVQELVRQQGDQRVGDGELRDQRGAAGEHRGNHAEAVDQTQKELVAAGGLAEVGDGAADDEQPGGPGPRDEDARRGVVQRDEGHRSEEHTSELQSLMRISYAVFCLKKKTNIITKQYKTHSGEARNLNNKR